MQGIKKAVRTLVLIALAGVIAFTVYNLFFFKPKVVGLEQLEKLPKRKDITLTVTPRNYVDLITVTAYQGPREVILFRGGLPERTNQITFRVEPKEIGLRDGPARIVVEVRRFYVLRESFEVQAIVDTEPPRVRIIYAPYVVRQGGSGAVRVKASEEVDLYVEVGEVRFRSYRVSEDNVHIAFFGVPPDTPVREVIKVVAVDRAGNRTVIPLGTGIRRNRFRRVTIDLTRREKLIRTKIYSLLGGNLEEMDFVTAFRKVNEELRRRDEERIREIGRRSKPERLWKGSFIQMPGSKVLSYYGEKRTYIYKGKVVSRSRHLGYDLASVRNSRVPAANSGIVVFAGDLGIYGNTVIIDHGFGVMSLYAHLADFKVREGERVKKGQIIGITDMTGLAFGDHLHFSILIDGYEVTPLEWWDPKWVRMRIEPVFSD
ncbi:MAG: M23 family metallopeptidase [Aquificota bacterium]|nr:M23 family metallopeptidase [Aquificota bacterium]